MLGNRVIGVLDVQAHQEGAFLYIGPNVDLMRLARATPGFSGADLAAIIGEIDGREERVRGA